MFNKDIYIKRRSVLKEKLGGGLIFLPGNDLMPMNYPDNHFHFRQDSNFLYFFGLDLPKMAGCMDIDSGEETLFGHNPTIEDVIWSGDQPTLNELANSSGVDQTKDYNQIDQVLQAAKSQNRPVHILPSYQGDQKIKMADWLGCDIRQLDSCVSAELIKAVVSQRSIKSGEEIAEIENAVDLTADMHLTAMKTAADGITEVQVSGKIEGVAVSGGGQLSFPVILTVNGQTLHNHYHGNVMRNGQLLLVDCGAENSMHYAGDMTRTFPVSGSFTEKQKEIYEIVLRAQTSVIDKLKPGANFLDVHLHACKIIAGGLNELGIIKGDVDDAVEAGAHALFMPHGLGHMMGLDVHDMEGLGEDYVGYTDDVQRNSQFGLSGLRLARALEPGFVLTNEPGIYFIPKLIEKWKSQNQHGDFINYQMLEDYMDFGGIRIEEDFLITAEGCQRLGKEVPKTILEVESTRQEFLG